MRLHLGIIAIAVGCAAHPSPDLEPGAAHDVVRAAVAPGEDVELTRETLIHDQTFTATRAQVWNALLAAEQDLAMGIASADSATSTVVYAVQTSTPRIAGRHAAVWLDCGRGPGGAPRVNTYDLSVRLTVFLESAGNGQTRVRTGLVGYARDRGLTGNRLPCTSTGELERRALAIVAARLLP